MNKTDLINAVAEQVDLTKKKLVHQMLFSNQSNNHFLKVKSSINWFRKL